jgi:hypothetical protein
VIVFVGLVVVLLLLLTYPGNGDDEEALGFIAANWRRIRRR